MVVPLQVQRPPPCPAFGLYSSAELRGREVYIANGCVYCHTQQPRAQGFGPDLARGWGGPPLQATMPYDKPHLLGTMRTGPDLMNIGVRQPSEQWHLGHLYQPRAYVPGSIMPSFPYLFEVKPADQVESWRGQGPVACRPDPGR